VNDRGALLDLPIAKSRDSAILCVDDEPEVLSALGRMLRSEPYEVLRARSGSEAIDLLGRVPVKVIVTDERMPEMSGSELLAEVRAKWPLVGRIILTGYPGPTLMIRSLQAGGDILMSKPWNERLKLMIRQLIKGVDRSWGIGPQGVEEPWHDMGGEGG
jgi:response regulator RpfG family c-di-GMP phosphodiesterase